MASPDDATRIKTLDMLAQTHLIKDDEVRSGVKDYKDYLDRQKKENPHSDASPQVVPAAVVTPEVVSDVAGAALTAPLTPNVRIYLLTGKPLDKADNGKQTLDFLRAPLLKAGYGDINGKFIVDSGRSKEPEVRFYNDSDKPEAEKLAGFFSGPTQTAPFTQPVLL